MLILYMATELAIVVQRIQYSHMILDVSGPDAAPDYDWEK